MASSMCLDGVPLDDLSSLLARFTALRVGKHSRKSSGESGGAPALLYADIEDATIEISDEESLFGAIAKLVQAGLPLKFRTMETATAEKPAENNIVNREVGRPEVEPLESKKRSRCDNQAMADDNDEEMENADASPSKRHAAVSPYRSHEHISSFGSGTAAKSHEGDIEASREVKPYVGMSVNAADGLIVSKPDLFEQLLKGRPVLARVRDASGVHTIREL